MGHGFHSKVLVYGMIFWQILQDKPLDWGHRTGELTLRDKNGFMMLGIGCSLP